MKKITDFQKWLIENFGGKTGKESIEIRTDSLISTTQQNKFPINLASIAKEIGINPQPLYEEQIYEGSITIHQNELRISLPLKTENNRQRFTYAHELIHCLFFDLKIVPPKRISPKSEGLEEEWICNWGACRILLPPFLVKKFVTDSNNRNLLTLGQTYSNFYSIKELSKIAKVSIYSVVIQLLRYDLLPNAPNHLYLLSSMNRGYQNRNKNKPRCIIGVYYDTIGKKNNFLPSNQGLQHIKSIKSKGGFWSLLSFFNSLNEKQMIVDKEIIIRDTDEKRFCISGGHYRIPETGYIWSEFIIHDLVATNDDNSEIKKSTTNKIIVDYAF